MKKVSLNTLELTIKEDWIVDIEDNIVLVYDPIKGCGALQISLFEVPNTERANLQKELSDFILEFLGNDVKDEIVFSKNKLNEYAFVESEINDRYWLYLCLKSKNNLIFITYNCEIKDKTAEDIDIWNVIHSLSFLST